MAGSTISGKVTTTVTLGSASYPSPLTVTGSGNVAVSAYGATGIYGPISSGTLINDGTVTGGSGSASSGDVSVGGTGGTGVDLLSASTATNNGTISGGIGGSSDQEGGTGGVGVYLASGATLTNQAMIIGGAGGAYAGHNVSNAPPGGGSGGVGVFLLGGSTAANNGTISGGAGETGHNGGVGGVGVYLANGAAFTNQATITGGAGGENEGGPNSAPGAGGAGVLLNGGTLTNSGDIAGGYSPGDADYGGSGVILLAGTLTNTGMIAGGGSPGVFDIRAPQEEDGVYLAASATLLNNGTIVGGQSTDDGGSGIYVAAGGTLTITGVVIGGAGGIGAGSGVRLADGGSLDNTGTVIGGAGEAGVGVYLAFAGTLTNAATIIGGAGVYIDMNSGDIPGGDGVYLPRGGVLVNAAFISGGSAKSNDFGAMGGDGVVLRHGTLTNDADAIITGGAGGYGVHSAAGFSGGAGAYQIGGTLINAGTITGGTGVGIVPTNFGGSGGIGVSLTGGGTLVNTGSIGGGLAGYYGVGGHGGTGVVMGSSSTASTVTNSDLITGGNGDDVAPGGTKGLVSFGEVAAGAGASIGSGNTLVNTGTIIGGTGVDIGASGAFFGYGSILGGDGVTEASGGTFLNTGTVISGAGVYLAAGGTLTTGGTVAGGMYAGVTADAVQFAAAGTLFIDPDASFVGQVVGSTSATDVLVLAYYGNNNGTLSGLGTQFTGFTQITIGANAAWTLAGANTIASGATLTELSGASLTATGTLVNDGSIVLDPSTMTVAALGGGGSTAIDAGSTLELQGSVASGQTIVFGGSGAYLHLDDPDSATGSITNFDMGETIDLKGIDPASVSYASGQLTFGGGDIPLALVGGGLVHASASTDGAAVFVLCFCANTLILTPTGERAVQDLAAGDLVVTHRGEARPIVWLGVGKVLVTRGQRHAATPVIVRKGALADNVPHRDLRVTKGHSLWFGGVLIPVEFLVNHRSVEWDDRAQEVELYHIELASHDVLVANGAAAESYRDDGNRWMFRNGNSGWELPAQAPCAPVLTGGPVVDAVWRRLLDRAGPRPGFALTGDPDLHLVVDGQRVDASERAGTAYVFRLAVRPASVRPVSVRIVSRAAAPAELGLARDPRVLGVAVRRIAVRQGTRFRLVDAGDGALAEGFYPFEAAHGLRWSDGDAGVPEALFGGFEGAMELVLQVGGTIRYPLFGAGDRRGVAA